MTPRPSPGPAARAPFGATWWGRQWVEALEERASLDPNRLPRGGAYAREGVVGELDVAAGEVTAPVRGSRREPYEVRVRVRQFSAGEWAAVTDALAAQVGHAAALLEGELPPEVAGDVRAVGLDLLPGAGEVQPRCSCPDWADPCKHAAAVCYLVADELDRDPFLLFLLRGRSREELLAGIRRQRGQGSQGGASRGAGGASADEGGSGSSPSGADPSLVDSSGGDPSLADLALADLARGWEEDTGVVAREAWAQDASPSPGAPVLPAPPRHAGRPALVLDAAPGGAGVDAGALRALASDAARRAWELANGSGDAALALSFEEDCARWAATMVAGAPAPLELDELARRAGLGRRELFLRGLAWRSGGRGGLAAYVEPWEPEPSDMEPGRSALGPGARASQNRVTSGDRQLRLGRDKTWYPYRKVRGAWQPEGEPADLRRGG